ncbi:MAG: cytochrome c-type biogenesis CcmF C-terminal domain-containing protein, partial [Dehalococcoidia bacterium]
GPPFFNQINGPIALVLLILMGVGPLLPWRRTDRARLRHLFLAPGLFAIGSLLLLWLAGIRDLLPLAGLGAAAFVVGTIVDEFWSGVLARRRHSTESIPLALARLVRRNNRRYGGYVVHLAIVMIGVGIIGSSFYKTEENVVLRPGETANVQEFSLQFSGLQHSTGPDTQTVSAPLRIAEEGHPAGTLVPTKVTHLNFAGQPPVTGVSIDTIHLKDLYIVLSRVNDNGSIDLLVFVNPLVSLIWLGGPLLLGGFLLCFWPASQPRQRSHPVPVVPVEVAVEA